MTEPIFDHERLDVYRLAIEYEYRDAEYEKKHESSDEDEEGLDRPFLTCVESTPRPR